MELTQTQPLSLINKLFIRRFLPAQLWKLCDENRAGTTTRRQPRTSTALLLHFDLALQLPLKHVLPGLKWHPQQPQTVSAISSPGKLSPSAEVWTTKQDFPPGFTALNYAHLSGPGSDLQMQLQAYPNLGKNWMRLELRWGGRCLVYFNQ